MKHMDPIQAKAKELLIESVKILGDQEADYCIVGGWIPFLQFDNHPGTKDVDILFRKASTEQAIGNIIRSFLDKDFCLSAKHDFQLLKKYDINGNSFIYNVDLLHPTLEIEKRGMFVDHLEIELDSAAKRVKNVKSIAIPYSEIFFQMNLTTTLKCDSFDVPVLNNIAFLLSKFPSARNVKRQRDIYDIYLTIKNDPETVDSILDFKKKDILTHVIEDFSQSLKNQKIVNHYTKSLEVFNVVNPDSFLDELRKKFG